MATIFGAVMLFITFLLAAWLIAMRWADKQAEKEEEARKAAAAENHGKGN